MIVTVIVAKGSFQEETINSLFYFIINLYKSLDNDLPNNSFMENKNWCIVTEFYIG